MKITTLHNSKWDRKTRNRIKKQIKLIEITERKKLSNHDNYCNRQDNKITKLITA